MLVCPATKSKKAIQSMWITTSSGFMSAWVVSFTSLFYTSPTPCHLLMFGDMSKSRAKETNMWWFLRDVFIASINKGQFPMAIVGLIFVILVLKMPSQDVSALVRDIFSSLKKTVGVSYSLNATLVIGWGLHSRWQRRQISHEMERMGREKTRLQEQQTGAKLANPKKSGA